MAEGAARHARQLHLDRRVTVIAAGAVAELAEKVVAPGRDGAGADECQAVAGARGVDARRDGDHIVEDRLPGVGERQDVDWQRLVPARPDAELPGTVKAPG